MKCGENGYRFWWWGGVIILLSAYGQNDRQLLISLDEAEEEMLNMENDAWLEII